MTIWILELGHPYDTSWIAGVFSTQEKAMNYVANGLDELTKKSIASRAMWYTISDHVIH